MDITDGESMKTRIMFFLIAGAMMASAQTWQSIGPYGGEIYPLCVNQNDVLYARFSNKLWTFADPAKIWYPVFSDCRFFKIGGDNNLYAEDLSNSIHVSTDWGKNWKVLPNARADINLERMAISATGVFYLANGSQVFTSTDQAATWKQVPGNFENSAEHVLLSGANIFIYGKSRLFRSADGGNTWQRLYSSLVDIQDFLAINANELLLSVGTESAGNIYRSADGGVSWSLTALPYARRLFFGAPNWLMGAAAQPDSPSAAHSFVSSNGGASARPADVGLPIYAFAVTSQGTLYAASSDGLWSSTDGGGSFTAVSPHAANAAGMVATAGGVLFAVTQNSDKYRFWQSHNGGAAWNEIDGKRWFGEPSQFFDLQVFPDNRLWLLLGYPTGDRSIIYESRDGGASWTVKRRSPLAFSGFAFDRSANACYAWDVSGKVFYRSADYGANWLPTVLTFNVLKMMPAGGGWVYALAGNSPGNPNALYRSFNNGVAWEPPINIAESEGDVALYCTNKFGDLFQIVARIGAGQTYNLTRVQRSVDAGASWQDITPKDHTSLPLRTAAEMTADDNGVLFLQTSAFVLKSVDNGDTWSPIFEKQKTDAEVRRLFVNETTILVGTFANSIFQTSRPATLFKSQNLDGIEYPIAKTFGVHWVDFDGDGWDDLFLTNDGRNELYKNNNGTLKRISGGEIVSDEEPSRAASWADYSNDGLPDLYVANNNKLNSLYRNLGTGAFKKITSGNIVEDIGSFRGCAWGDVNKDGFLDLYLTRVEGANILYLATGTGNFNRSTANLIGGTGDRSYGCAWADFDNDGDLDLYVCNDGPDQLWEQVSPMKFSLVNQERITPNTGLSVGCSWGDVNNDGFLDLLVTNANKEAANRLYLNNGNGSFRTAGGIISTDAAVSKGSGWADFDNDGDLDLLISNNGSFFIYRNNGGSFEREAAEFTYFGGNSHSVAWADVDNDGDLDVAISSYDRKTVLYKNNSPAKNWLKINCEGSASNKGAVGAQVRVKAVINGRAVWQMREISSQTGYAAQNSMVQHFGLGDAARVDSITVVWPNGKRQSMANVAINQTILLREAADSRVEMPTSALTAAVRLLPNRPNPFNGTTTISFELPRPSEVSVEIYDAAGRRVRTLLNKTLQAGAHTLYWDGRDDQGVCPSGLYFVKLTSASFSQVIKMTLLK
mgnify:CR=1 FL=1